MGDKLDRSKFSLDLQRETRQKTPPTCLPDLSQVGQVVTPLGQQLALTPCVLTAEDIQKISVATPDLEKLLNMSAVVSLSTATTPNALVAGNKNFSSDKEDYCKGLLQDMEASMKNRSDSSSSLPFSEPITSIVQPQSSTTDLLRSFKTVKLPFTGTSAIILPNSSLTNNIAASVANLISTSSTNALPIVRTSSGYKLTTNELLNPMHSAFGSPYPVAIVNPQPHVSVPRKTDVGNNMTSTVAASVILGGAPRIKHAQESFSGIPSVSRSSTEAGCSKQLFQSIANTEGYDDNSDYSVEEDDDRDDESSYASPSGMYSLGKAESSGSLPNVNYEDQELMKRERKRLRNRIAATKCRQKKIAKIQTFEEQIKELKRKHEELSQQKASLKEKTSLLKENVLFHVKKGCKVIAPIALAE